MITSKISLTALDVAHHYDELDDFYRLAWGDHVHHGLWDNENDTRSVEDATLHLLQRLTSTLHLKSGDHLADIGCGYGASSRWLAQTHGLNITALTISEKQTAQARLEPPPSSGHIDYRVEDWLQNSLPDNSLHAAIAIESLAHMEDKALFFQQIHRTLKPGAHAALAVWTTADDLTRLESHLLQKVCEEGRLPGMGTLQEYQQLAASTGLLVTEAVDITPQVERTWWIITRRVLTGLFTNPHYLRFILNRAFRKRIFVLTLPRLLLAYRTGAMRYAIITLQKPH
ncbi:MAG: class I SAM-dependent methyltransferase [Akkermansiaceae bacterium]|nr:class I SAM-dependent methyltransferase [Akkermansiaceae bacterium]